jgi:ketosteroid isomerase-like protein
MTDNDARSFAEEWVAAWNSHDLDRILSYYADEIEFLSPMAFQRTGKGRIVGIPELRAYWGSALANQPNLKFDLLDVLIGHDCLTILYRNHRGQQVAETCEFNDAHKVTRSFACYG